MKLLYLSLVTYISAITCIPQKLNYDEQLDNMYAYSQNRRLSHDDEYVKNHSFVFISGWPQSGTSFIYQLLHQYQFNMSTMILNCEKYLTVKRCVNWNHEGQWILDGKTRPSLLSGNICPLESVSDESRNSIIAQVSILFRFLSSLENNFRLSFRKNYSGKNFGVLIKSI